MNCLIPPPTVHFIYLRHLQSLSLGWRGISDVALDVRLYLCLHESQNHSHLIPAPPPPLPYTPHNQQHFFTLVFGDAWNDGAVGSNEAPKKQTPAFPRLRRIGVVQMKQCVVHLHLYLGGMDGGRCCSARVLCALSVPNLFHLHANTYPHTHPQPRDGAGGEEGGRPRPAPGVYGGRWLTVVCIFGGHKLEEFAYERRRL